MNRYVGHESQLYSVEEHILVGGKGNGMRLLEIRNGRGLELTISLDRCADISRLIYKGINLSYMSPVGYVHPSYFVNKDTKFLDSFTAGFLTTAGLNNVGDPGFDNNEELGLHGTIANTPCSYYSYEVKNNKIHIKAIVHDEVIFSHKLVLTRNIYISLTKNKFYIEDEISNEGDVDYPALILYHMNLGYPLISENTKLFINHSSITARNDRALEGIDEYDKMLKPTSNFVEQCYFFKFNNKALASVYNKDIKTGLSISFDPTNLKCMTEWKMMGVRDYVLGLEPGNCYPGPRSEKRLNNELNILKVGQKVKYRVDINVFDKMSSFNKLKEVK